MVACPDAVIDPRAVMIESLNTLAADAAVAGPICPNYLAVRAQQNWIELLKHLHESHTSWFLEVARVLAHSDNMHKCCHHKQE